MPRKILVAVAWPYASGLRHIGHVAGFGVPSDTFARYHRLRGNDVLMVSGTDEHGTPVRVAADSAGESPRETADRFNQLIREDLRNIGLSYDLFTRTTTANHYAVVQDIVRTLYEKGYIVEQETFGAFSASTGHTLPDRYIEGTCPICGYESARGDQCDNCGNQLDPVDLVDPRSRIDGEPPVFEKTRHLFLDLPAFKDQLLDWIGSREGWRSNVRAFSLNFVRDVKPHVPDGVHFIPGHPIAGTEHSGPEAGFAELFDNRWCILTPVHGTDPGAVARLKELWQRMGSHVELMTPDHHDLVLAITSHVPHLIAYNIVNTAAHLERVTDSEVIKFSAGGFRDFTRIAASDPTMWRDVFLNNKEAVLEMLGRFSEDLTALQRAIRYGEGETLFKLFSEARAIRRGIIEAGQDTAAPDFGRRQAKGPA